MQDRSPYQVNNTDFELIVADAPDREKVFAEIHYRGEEVAELLAETDSRELVIYSKNRYNPDDHWTFKLDEFKEVLSQAEDKLKGV